MPKRLFITATGTGIGKSFVTAALVRQAMKLNLSVAAYKPIISGFDPAQLDDSDTGLLLQSLRLTPTPDKIEQISPWRFTAPLAPAMAAAREQRSINFDEIVAHSQTVMRGPEDIVLIEGVGGVMVPLDERHTILDWIAAIECAAIVVTGSYLGCLSHALTALAVLQQRKIPVQAVIVNESENSSVPLTETCDELARWTGAPVIAVKRRASAHDWQNVPELSELLA